MATVNVSNFDEFVSAVAVSGDTVNLPSGATWDLNDSYPEGYTGNIPINCAAINGNGTEIKNLHFYGKFVVPAALEINDLYMKNIIGESDVIFDYGSSSGREITMNGCIMSGLFGVDTQFFVKGILNANRSTINFDMTNFGHGYQVGISGALYAKYCRISAQFPTSTRSGLEFGGSTGMLKFCMLNINFLGCEYIKSSEYSGCVILGNYGAAYDLSTGSHGKFVSVFDVAAMADGFTPANAYFFGVTYDQLYDAAYLASIGFPIGV